MTNRLANVPGVVLVSIAATMWGLDGLIRKPLSHTTTATTIVFGEHVVLVACTITLLVPALASLWRAGPRYVLAGILVGAGASAVATILFTQALFHGDFITVIVLQKSQPLIAVVGAWLVLGEQPRRGFAWFLLPALAGIWLIALLALVTGLAALGLYYYGLRRTPALLAALGELAFPVTATLVGIYVFNSSLRWTQWIGVAVTVGVVSLLPARRRDIVRAPDFVAAPAAS